MARPFLTSVRRLMHRTHAAAPAAPGLGQVEEHNRAIVERCLPETMTGHLRLEATVDAVRYCVARDVPGAFVECGVWRGGSLLAMALTLLELGVRDREIYGFDTFEGMTEPTEHDVARDGTSDALVEWREAQARGERPWSGLFGADRFDLESVRATVTGSGYPAERIHLVEGEVEQTLPDEAPGGIALLRLDTDWYRSTRHELHHLYPRLADGGVLIVDDYGHWQGARQAVDEYFGSQAEPLLLNRIDYTGRIAVKR
jgi:O-methyltransferase